MGSNYFVGDELTAAAIYWACFSQLVAPLDEDVNRMPDGGISKRGCGRPDPTRTPGPHL